DEKQKSWFQECAEAFAAVPAVNTSAYMKSLLTVLTRLSADGNCVILGRGAAQVLPGTTTLRVRVVAPLEHRIEAFQQKLGFTVLDSPRETTRSRSERATLSVKDLHPTSTPAGIEVFGQPHTPPDSPAQAKPILPVDTRGQILAIRGPVIDVAFGPGELPHLY